MQQAGSFMSSLDGRVAFVTGAASGIGRAIALELGGWGARVAVADLDAAGAVETVAQLAEVLPPPSTAGGSPGPADAERGRGLAVPLDVTDYAAVQRAFAFVGDRLGRVDVLVNAA